MERKIGMGVIIVFMLVIAGFLLFGCPKPTPGNSCPAPDPGMISCGYCSPDKAAPGSSHSGKCTYCPQGDVCGDPCSDYCTKQNTTPPNPQPGGNNGSGNGVQVGPDGKLIYPGNQQCLTYKSCSDCVNAAKSSSSLAGCKWFPDSGTCIDMAGGIDKAASCDSGRPNAGGNNSGTGAGGTAKKGGTATGVAAKTTGAAAAPKRYACPSGYVIDQYYICHQYRFCLLGHQQYFPPQIFWLLPIQQCLLVLSCDLF